MHPLWDVSQLKAEYRAAEATCDDLEERFKARLSEADQKELYLVVRALEDEKAAWLFFDKARLVDAIALHFPWLPIRVIAHHVTEAMESLEDDCGLVEREDQALA